MLYSKAYIICNTYMLKRKGENNVRDEDRASQVCGVHAGAQNSRVGDAAEELGAALVRGLGPGEAAKAL